MYPKNQNLKNCHHLPVSAPERNVMFKLRLLCMKCSQNLISRKGNENPYTFYISIPRDHRNTNFLSDLRSKTKSTMACYFHVCLPIIYYIMNKIKRSKVRKEIWVSVILGIDIEKISEYSFPTLNMRFWLQLVHSKCNFNTKFISGADARGREAGFFQNFDS